MTQRLVWNFEFTDKNTTPLNYFAEHAKDILKWEVRFFWSDSERICLNLIEPSLLNLTHYKSKHKDDYYYLIPGSNHNIKRRRGELLYKPIVEQRGIAIGYGNKVGLEVVKNAQEVSVKKESFTFAFPTTPSIKLELARLEVHNKIYFSACIEGRSLYWVETLSKSLLEQQNSCDYVSFLNKIVKP